MSVSTGVAVFAEDIAIRHYAEKTNTITPRSEFDQGGHVAALNHPICSSRTCGRSSARASTNHDNDSATPTSWGRPVT